MARVMTAVLKDDVELFKQFSDNESFRRWMTDTIFSMTYEPEKKANGIKTESQPSKKIILSNSLLAPLEYDLGVPPFRRPQP